MTTWSEPAFPSMGVADKLLPEGTAPADRFLLWLQTYAAGRTGARFWQTAVLRECLPSPEHELTFEAGEFLGLPR